MHTKTDILRPYALIFISRVNQHVNTDIHVNTELFSRRFDNVLATFRFGTELSHFYIIIFQLFHILSSSFLFH